MLAVFLLPRRLFSFFVFQCQTAVVQTPALIRVHNSSPPVLVSACLRLTSSLFFPLISVGGSWLQFSPSRALHLASPVLRV